MHMRCDRPIEVPVLHSEPWSVVLVNSVDVEPGTVDVTLCTGGGQGSARPAGAGVAELARSLTMVVKSMTTLLVLESEVSGRSGKSRTVPRRERRQ